MCGLEFPDLEASVYQPYKDQDVIVVGINPGAMMMGGESAARVRAFVDQTRVTFPVGFDDGDSYKMFPYGGAISPFPLDVIVDRDGTIVYAERRYDGRAIRRAVADAVAR